MELRRNAARFFAGCVEVVRMLALVTAVAWIQPGLVVAGEASIFVFGFSAGFVAGAYFLGCVRRPN
jgi:hypothetical protein